MILKKLILVTTILLSQISFHAQNMQELAEKQALSCCTCIENISYIDSQVDFELKMDSCALLSTEDSLKIITPGGHKEYKAAFYDYFQNNCDDFTTKRNALFQSNDNESYTSLLIVDSLSPNNQNVIGSYSLAFGNHQPEGSAHLSILKNHTYVITYFGGAQFGHWKIIKDKYLHLNPLKPKYPFAIFGRNDPTIKHATNIVFMGDDFNANTFINLEEINQEIVNLTPIYNEDANCIEYPSKTKIKVKPNNISIACRKWPAEKDTAEIKIFSFPNPDKYNDFIIYEYLEKYNLKSTRVIIDGDNLIFGKNQITTRSPLPKAGSENYDFITTEVPQIIKNEFINTPKYYNPGYKAFDEATILSEIYKYNLDDNTYIGSYYDCKTEKGKDCYEADDYDNNKVVNRYQPLLEIVISKKQYITIEKPLIYNVCD